MTELVIEYHYMDGSVGAHPVDVPEGQEALGEYLWSGFAQTDHEVSHIVIRPDTSTGQALSDRLYAAPDLLAALDNCRSALEGLGQATAPFVTGAISSHNPSVCFACAAASHALAHARAAIAKAKGGAS